MATVIPSFSEDVEDVADFPLPDVRVKPSDWNFFRKNYGHSEVIVFISNTCFFMVIRQLFILISFN